MEELVKFLTSKIGYTLTAILGFGLPGNLFIFVWNREIYLEMDILKLIILSFAITFIVYIPNIFLITSVCKFFDAILKRRISSDQFIFSSIVCTMIEMIVAMIIKIISPNYTIEMLLEDTITELVVAYLIIIIGGEILGSIINRKNQRSNN